MIEKHKPVQSLESITIFLYGPPKIGKTSFAVAQGDGVLVLECDPGGADFMECYKVPIPDWATLLATLKDVAESKQFKTIVIDTIDRAHQHCRDYVCAQFKVKHESEDKGYGRVWDAVTAELMRVIGKIKSQGLGLWFISHSTTADKKVGILTKKVTTWTTKDKLGRALAAISDIIWYLDIDEDGKRELRCLPEDSLECGDRTGMVSANIVYNSPAEAWEKIRALIGQKGNK